MISKEEVWKLITEAIFVEYESLTKSKEFMDIMKSEFDEWWSLDKSPLQICDWMAKAFPDAQLELIKRIAEKVIGPGEPNN